MKYRTGFTLIELLTVIIIIGVLSAVAVPQYQKAIEKGKFTKAEVMAKSLYDSCERLVAEWGVESYSSLPSNVRKISRLDIGSTSLLPTGFSLNTDTNTIIGAGFSYKLTGDPRAGTAGQCYVRISKTAGNYQGTILEYDGSQFFCSGNATACNIYGFDYTDSLYGS